MRTLAPSADRAAARAAAPAGPTDWLRHQSKWTNIGRPGQYVRGMSVGKRGIRERLSLLELGRLHDRLCRCVG